MILIPTKPVKPPIPTQFKALAAAASQALAALAKATALGFDLPGHAQAVTDTQRALDRWLASDAGLEYARQVRQYNQAALAYNKAVAAATQSSINERERRTIRAQMCQSCWTVHRPEIECS